MHKVDVQFRLLGEQIQADHGYPLFSAISDLVPGLHDDKDVGVHPISGQLVGDRQLALTDRSFLTIRLASDRIGEVLPLAGKTVHIGRAQVRVGVPQTQSLVPAARLYSRQVVIKGFMEPELFLEAVHRQMETLDIRGEASLVAQPEIVVTNEQRATGTHSPYLRRTIRIREKKIVGFALRVQDLTAEESIRVQEQGLGGRRRFGCGIFIPDRK